MRKVLILCAVFALVAAFTLPAAAVDHKFGGFWRTRAFTNSYFTGNEYDKSLNWSGTDTRTRLYYTAVLHENLKLVNKFEMDANWGTGGAKEYGDIGADGVAVEVKNTYADFNLGDFNFKVGTQGFKLARGFLFNDDATGLNVTYKAGGFSLPLYWVKVNEGGEGDGLNKDDVDIYGLAPKFKAGGFSVQPYLLYLTSNRYGTYGQGFLPAKEMDVDVYYVGADVDGKIGTVSLWVSGIMETGDVEDTAQVSYDVNAYLFGVGASIKFGSGDIHAEFISATGDDNAADKDLEDWFIPKIFNTRFAIRSDIYFKSMNNRSSRTCISKHFHHLFSHPANIIHNSIIIEYIFNEIVIKTKHIKWIFSFSSFIFIFIK